jgi:hypothetical protein
LQDALAGSGVLFDNPALLSWMEIATPSQHVVPFVVT